MPEQLQALLRELGRLLLQWREQGLTSGRWQGTQFKAWADQQAHDFLLTHLRDLWPALPVISEEDTGTRALQRPEEYWLIDPIDGTASFVGGFNGFVTQVALIRRGQPALGVVHAPAPDLMYSASLGGQAYCNGRRIRCREVVGRPPNLIDNYPQPRGLAKALYEQLPCNKYLESGSLGLKICHVADGTADLFVKDVMVRDWDLAPAHLVLTCAGGVLTQWDGEPLTYEGDHVRNGVLAAADPALAQRVAQWRTDAVRQLTDKR